MGVGFICKLLSVFIFIFGLLILDILNENIISYRAIKEISRINILLMALVD